MQRAELLSLPDEALLRQCQVDRLRGSGPGGQKRNKTESSIRLRHQATGLSALSGESRSQHQNKARALRRLRERIAFDLREPVDLDDYQVKPALGALLAVEPVRRSEKWLRSVAYLAGVGELLDLYHAVACSVPHAARMLGADPKHIEKIARVDVRLARKMGEMKNTLRGKPVV